MAKRLRQKFATDTTVKNIRYMYFKVDVTSHLPEADRLRCASTMYVVDVVIEYMAPRQTEKCKCTKVSNNDRMPSLLCTYTKADQEVVQTNVH